MFSSRWRSKSESSIGTNAPCASSHSIPLGGGPRAGRLLLGAGRFIPPFSVAAGGPSVAVASPAVVVPPEPSAAPPEPSAEEDANGCAEASLSAAHAPAASTTYSADRRRFALRISL